ncbi:MAG: hypothetical protein M1828_001721 [Chrysothrix sp. TS-e1954]|nr:MAG: hypothetical protein M1828_001721 [Chrysothrix sp. TS-e1954]
MTSPWSIQTSIVTLLAVADLVVAQSLPGCQQVAPPVKSLTSVRTAELQVPEDPFGIVYATLQPDTAFVSQVTNLGVLDTNSFPPRLVHNVSLSQNDSSGDLADAAGIALTHDGRYILVTDSSTATFVVDAAKAASGSADAVVGALIGTSAAGNSSIQVTVTHDDEYAFVSQEDGSAMTGSNGTIEVFKLHYPKMNALFSSDSIGYIELGYLVVGTALSPDGKYLYATSEQKSNTTTTGTLSVLDVEKLKITPKEALVSSTSAGCGPVRVLVSQDGQIVWVTARESNHLLAFDAKQLVSQPQLALVASVQVGTSPVGLAFVKNESRIIVADSNRFMLTDTTTGLTVVDVDAALAGRQAVFGMIPTGVFPREFALSPDGETLLVSDYGNFAAGKQGLPQVQAIDVRTIP